jgi:hypothetical protein
LPKGHENSGAAPAKAAYAGSCLAAVIDLEQMILFHPARLEALLVLLMEIVKQ